MLRRHAPAGSVFQEPVKQRSGHQAPEQFSMGRTWDGMPILRLQVTDLRREAIDLFKEKALRRHRLTEEETRVMRVISIWIC